MKHPRGALLFLSAETPALRWLCVLAVIVLFPSASLRADNVYETTAQGTRQVIQRDAIVIHNDSAYLIYKHFDLKERRVEKVSLAKGSLPYIVEPGSADAHRDIVSLWKKFGFTLTVTDRAGKTSKVYDAYLDFYPPGGRGSLLESVPALTSLTLLLSNGSPDEVKFEDIGRVEISGDTLRITRRDGRVEEGKFLPPTTQPVETRLLGITDKYDPSSEDVFDFSVPLSRLKEISFGR
jgi:hypothetical protein